MKVIKYVFTLIASVLILTSKAQDIPKGTNTIKITGVGFREIAVKLIDSGFTFEKIDSNFQTLRTEYNEVNRYLIKYDIRVKDSVATIKGWWTSSNIIFDIEYQKFFPDRNIFAIAKDFALSFGKPVEYLKK